MTRALKTPPKKKENRVHPHDDETAKKESEKLSRSGKKATTAAGPFVHEEMHLLKEGKKGIKNRGQAIAIGLSKARRAGVKVPPKDGNGRTSTGRKARRSTRSPSTAKTGPKKIAVAKSDKRRRSTGSKATGASSTRTHRRSTTATHRRKHD